MLIILQALRAKGVERRDFDWLESFLIKAAGIY